MRDVAMIAQLGRLVRTARQAEGMTQEVLAWETGLVPSQISLLERGKRVPGLFAMLRLLEAVGLGVELLQETGKSGKK